MLDEVRVIKGNFSTSEVCIDLLLWLSGSLDKFLREVEEEYESDSSEYTEGCLIDNILEEGENNDDQKCKEPESTSIDLESLSVEDFSLIRPY